METYIEKVKTREALEKLVKKLSKKNFYCDVLVKNRQIWFNPETEEQVVLELMY